MILVTYWDAGIRKGMLAWVEEQGASSRALGGFDPGIPDPTAEFLVTTVITDLSSRSLAGWIHPDQLAEVSGQDSPEVAQQMENQAADDTAANVNL